MIKLAYLPLITNQKIALVDDHRYRSSCPVLLPSLCIGFVLSFFHRYELEQRNTSTTPTNLTSFSQVPHIIYNLGGRYRTRKRYSMRSKMYWHYAYVQTGAFPKALTLQTQRFLRCESEIQSFDTFHFLHFFHSSPAYKNYCIISFHRPQELFIYITLHYSYGNSFILVCNYLVFNTSLRLIVKKECFDLALMWAITGVFFRGHFRSLITRA